MSARQPRKPAASLQDEAGTTDRASGHSPEERPSPHRESGRSSQDPTAAADMARNASHFGARTRRVVRAMAKVFNPLVLAIAGRRYMPIVGKVQHLGRRSGRIYTAPLGVRPLGDGFVMPVTFSEASQWYQNIRAAGWSVVTYGGAEHYVIGPVIVGRSVALPAFPRYERLLLRLLGIHEFLSLAKSPRGMKAPGDLSEPN